MIESLRLRLDFDPDALREDLARIPSDRWILHFNKAVYKGNWSGVALRGPANVTHPIQSLVVNPGTEVWANTDLHALCPYFAHVMDSLECPLLSVRLLSLAPGAVIEEHTDNSLSFEDGELRLHIPVQTDPEVEFLLNGVRVPLGVGETWYLNVNLPHSVANRSSQHRVHMVVDCTVNGWLRELFGCDGEPA